MKLIYRKREYDCWAALCIAGLEGGGKVKVKFWASSKQFSTAGLSPSDPAWLILPTYHYVEIS